MPASSQVLSSPAPPILKASGQLSAAPRMAQLASHPPLIVRFRVGADDDLHRDHPAT
jgi:hypothetical protein